jgi:hypothetical protein
MRLREGASSTNSIAFRLRTAISGELLKSDADHSLSGASSESIEKTEWCDER